MRAGIKLSLNTLLLTILLSPLTTIATETHNTLQPYGSAPTIRGQLVNNAEHNLTQFAAKLHQGNQQIHIVQIGDSHTAADFFTGELRHLFQQHYGDAGPGFVPPIAIPGQRTATINRLSDKSDWSLSSSRQDKRIDHPLGG